MPSLYSLGFALAGCKVSLVNPDQKAKGIWKELGLLEKVKSIPEIDIYNTSFKDNSFDLAWNCITFTKVADQEKLLLEMKRVSSRRVLIIACNNFQTGYLIHRVIHKAYGFPWTHGDTKYNYPWNVKNAFKNVGLNVIEWGCIDSPPWPDPAGPRDIRLHKNYSVTQGNPNWYAPIVEHIKKDEYPSWMKLLSSYDLPLRKGPLKLLFSHLFYVLGEKEV